MREGLHGNNDCTSLHLTERWADTEDSNLNLIQLTNPLILRVHWLSMAQSRHCCWLSGPYFLCMTWNCYYCMLIRQLALLISCLIWVTYLFGFNLNFGYYWEVTVKASVIQRQIFLRWIKQKVCGGWMVAPLLLHQSFIPLADWALIIHRINELLMFVSQFCARCFLPHLQLRNVHVMNAATWGRRLVTSSLTTLTGRTSGRSILNPPSKLFISLWD